MRILVALALLALVPAASAAPLVSTMGILGVADSWLGVATQGSHDRSRDWLGEAPVCHRGGEPFLLTLWVEAGAPDDALALRTSYGWAEARLGEPARLLKPEGSDCDVFVVEGTRVAAAALYRVTVCWPPMHLCPVS
ncbi:MAG TPA: hypothetical protein VFH78_02575 [Candidatus Thermoplasmatota archaeon]|nr:hypothetical protein [Candidatus Thermoplasmatota archaeon]